MLAFPAFSSRFLAVLPSTSKPAGRLPVQRALGCGQTGHRRALWLSD